MQKAEEMLRKKREEDSSLELSSEDRKTRNQSTDQLGDLLNSQKRNLNPESTEEAYQKLFSS